MAIRSAEPTSPTSTAHPASPSDLHRLAMWSLVGLVGLRIVTSWNWLNGAFLGKDRKIAPDFLGGHGVTTRVDGFFSSHALYPWIGHFMTSTVNSNAAAFGMLIFLGEAVAGVCLLLGLFTRLGAIAAILSAIMNIMAAAGGGGDNIGQNYLLLALGLVFLVVPVGRFLGLDAVLQRRSDARIWRILG